MTKFHNTFQMSMHHTESDVWLVMHYTNANGDKISNPVINIEHGTIGNKCQWDSNGNIKFLIEENAFKNVFCEIAAILSWVMSWYNGCWYSVDERTWGIRSNAVEYSGVSTNNIMTLIPCIFTLACFLFSKVQRRENCGKYLNILAKQSSIFCVTYQ